MRIRLRDVGLVAPAADNGSRRGLLAGINTTFATGEVVAVLGPNGSGKTLIAKLLCGLLTPTTGSITVDDSSHGAVAVGPELVGVVFEHTDLQVVEQTVRADVAFGPAARGLPADEVHRRTDHWLQRFDLTALSDRDPLSLSAGESKRLAMAGVIAADPAFLVLDEVFANLDWPGVRSLLAALKAAAGPQRGIVIISHEVERFLAHVDRVLILNAGRLVFDGLLQAAAAQLQANGIHRPVGPPQTWTWAPELVGDTAAADNGAAGDDCAGGESAYGGRRPSQ